MDVLVRLGSHIDGIDDVRDALYVALGIPALALLWWRSASANRQARAALEQARLQELKQGRRAVGKAAVVYMKDRETNRVTAEAIESADGLTLKEFVLDQVADGKMSRKHLGRYVNEFSGRHNARSEDTLGQMAGIAYRMGGRRLMYRDLIASRGAMGSQGGSDVF